MNLTSHSRRVAPRSVAAQATDNLTPFERDMLRNIEQERAVIKRIAAANPLTTDWTDGWLDALDQMEAWARGYLGMSRLPAARTHSAYMIGRMTGELHR